jgi:sulfopyruvate decarboxylase alpha subunit
LELSLADALCADLLDAGLDRFLATPCGILAPLHAALQRRADLVTVSREDNAVAMAAGLAMAGGFPAVLMQNSGLGQSVNALASLVVPYRIPVLLIVSLRGTGTDPTPENAVMGRLTQPLFAQMGIQAETVCRGEPPAVAVRRVTGTVRFRRRPAALLIAPDAFGWTA